MIIGIATPMHVDDRIYLPIINKAFENLDPKPSWVMIHHNKGEKSLGYYRTYLFDELFINGCDVVLQCSADHKLHKNILSYIEDGKITTFAYCKMRATYIIDFMRFLISPSMWTGCYSITLDFWELFKKDAHFDSWDGGDYAIVLFAEEIAYPIKRIRTPKYTLLNPSKGNPFEKISDYPFWKKIIRRISWIDHYFEI